MKKCLLVLVSCLLYSFAFAQGKGVKIGYIDMEYILENTPDYKEAASQLEQKAQKWKLEIEAKKNNISKLKDILKNERTLLTKELIEEREEEIKFLETEMMDYQQKRFGPNGDLMIQKTGIIKPVQDQVFNAVQDIAEAKQFDFIFDKSSDLTMLFSAKRFDLSDRIVSIITRTEKREEMSRKQQKALEEKEKKEDEVLDNAGLSERKKLLDEKKAARDKILEERKQTADQKRKDFEDRKVKLKAAQKGATTTNSETENKTTENKTNDLVNEKLNLLEKTKAKQDSLKNAKEVARLLQIEKNKKSQQERQKILEEKRKKILEDRETLKKQKSKN